MLSTTRLSWRSRLASYVVSNTGFDSAAFATTLSKLRVDYFEKGRADTFGVYQDLLAGLRDIPDLQVVPLCELMTTPSRDKKILALRYDIDADPVTAVRLARFNARYGLCGSFFLLHTAYYYATLGTGVWRRNSELLREWVVALVLAGAEVGLHIDPLSLYAENGVDGAAAVRTELAFLRSLGAKVVGTVAHNSLPVYGAENFEVFRGRTVWQRDALKVRGRRIPLGVLDEERLGLTYEGNYSVPVSATPGTEAQAWLAAPLDEAANRESWMRCYLLDNPCYRRAYEAVVWHHGGGQWTMAAQLPGQGPLWVWKASQGEMLAWLRALPSGIRTAAVMHPIGFSADAV